MPDESSGMFGRVRSWFGAGNEGRYSGGTEEETQGLLGLAGQHLSNAADMAGAKLGGGMGAAMQVATISQNQWILFFALLAMGLLLSAAAWATLPLLVLAPHKFACTFTAGSLCLLSSVTALKGVWPLVSHLTSKEKLPFSIGYFGSMAGTLWASLWYRSTLLTMAFSIAQIVQLMWFLVSYIPGGPIVMGYVQDAFCGMLGRACCGYFFKSGSIPL